MADFFVAPCNRDAVAWVDRWPEWPAPALVLHGPAGSGKSHLAEVWRGKAEGARLSLENLESETVAMRADSVCTLIDPVVMPFDQEALLHLFNATAERNGHLLLVAEVPASRWSLTLADLRSRLQAAPSVGIGAPDDGLIGAVMVKQFADRQLNVDPEVLTFLLARMERSFEAASRLVAALDKAALAEKRRITVPLAGDVLSSLTE